MIQIDEHKLQTVDIDFFAEPLLLLEDENIIFNAIVTTDHNDEHSTKRMPRRFNTDVDCMIYDYQVLDLKNAFDALDYRGDKDCMPDVSTALNKRSSQFLCF